MRDLLSWNIYLGRVAGVQIRLHAFFLLLLAVALASRHQVPLWYSFSAIAILFFSVVWHEIAHCLVAVKTGGSADHILLWPLGGLVQVNTYAHDPQLEWPTAVAGILGNMMICAFAAPILLLTGEQGLHVNPFSLPAAGPQLSWHGALQLAFWTNWVLLLVNILPAFPFDGARLLRASLWPRQGFRTASLQTVRVAKLVAIALIVVGLVIHERHPSALVVLTGLGVVVYFASRQEVDRLQDTEPEDRVFGYDFSQGYTSLERPANPPPAPKQFFLRRWWDKRRETRMQRRREQEEIEDLRMDDVLARLHEAGVDGLSSEDRALLERVSMRYRNRHRT